MGRCFRTFVDLLSLLFVFLAPLRKVIKSVLSFARRPFVFIPSFCYYFCLSLSLFLSLFHSEPCFCFPQVGKGAFIAIYLYLCLSQSLSLSNTSAVLFFVAGNATYKSLCRSVGLSDDFCLREIVKKSDSFTNLRIRSCQKIYLSSFQKRILHTCRWVD